MEDTEALRKKRATERRREQRKEANDFLEVMGTPAGRRVVYTQLAHAGVFRTTFAADPYVSAFNEGQRNGGLWLFARITQHTPEHYALMLKENTSE